MWKALTDKAHDDGTLNKSLTVKDIMDTWTLQKGYPVVTLTRNYTNNQVTLTQRWFLLNGMQKKFKTVPKWFVPFTHTTSKGTLNDFVFEPQTKDLLWLTPSDSESGGIA